jgi:hypothetical protein
MDRPFYMERALFVVGQPGAGKSAHLKHMFRDWRFGNEGEPWDNPGPIPVVFLSNERKLRIFLQSAQERDRDIQPWIDRIRQSFDTGRWCFAGALQAEAGDELPNALEYIQAFIEALAPERVRICFLSPDGQGRTINTFLEFDGTIRSIELMDNVESALIDFQLLDTNALMMADFFDFA